MPLLVAAARRSGVDRIGRKTDETQHREPPIVGLEHIANSDGFCNRHPWHGEGLASTCDGEPCRQIATYPPESNSVVAVERSSASPCSCRRNCATIPAARRTSRPRARRLGRGGGAYIWRAERRVRPSAKVKLKLAQFAQLFLALAAVRLAERQLQPCLTNCYIRSGDISADVCDANRMLSAYSALRVRCAIPWETNRSACAQADRRARK